jgi:hypothetical protein
VRTPSQVPITATDSLTLQALLDCRSMVPDDFYASPFGVAYSAYMERPRLSRLISRTVWGGDSKPYYESMGAIAEVPDGGTIVDCPCGAGPALRAVRPDAPVTKFTLEMQGGKKGLLVNSSDLCAAKHHAIADFTGHNGKIHNFNPVVKNDCGGKAKKKGKRHSHRAAR